MQLGMVGLGRMGANMCQRLHNDGHEVIGFDLGAPARAALEDKGMATAASLEALVAKLSAPRICWVMVPAGGPTDDTVHTLAGLLSAGDIVIDGGNSNYKTAPVYAAELARAGIAFVDAGTSGGVWGLENGYCLMVGGDKDVVARAEPIFKTLAPVGGYAHVGPVGAGHFVKMVHNGIEYGLMQSYAEGFEVMNSSEFDLDLHEIAGIWRYGSVVRSWLLELLHASFETDGPHLEKIKGYVEDSGEGRWTIHEAMAEDVPVPVITAALFARFASRQDESFAAKVNAALRNQFGGHAVRAES